MGDIEMVLAMIGASNSKSRPRVVLSATEQERTGANE
jgi:hypothetical protein